MEATTHTFDKLSEKMSSSENDQRLAAIKKILVGNQLERMEKRFTNLLRRAEGSNSNIISVVDELSKELRNLKKDINLKLANETQKRYSEDDQLRETVLKLENQILKGTKGEYANFPHLEKRIDELENMLQQNLATVHSASQNESKISDSEKASLIDKIASHTQALSQKIGRLEYQGGSNERQIEQLLKMNKQELRLMEAELKAQTEHTTQRQNQFNQKLEQRLGQLDQKIDAQAQSEHHQRISALEESYKEFKTLGTEAFEEKLKAQSQSIHQEIARTEERLMQHQDKFQQGVQDLLESMASKINQRFVKASENHRELAAKVQNQSQNQVGEGWKNKVEAVEQQVQQMQEVLNNDMVGYFEKMKERQDRSLLQINDFQKQMEHKLDSFEEKLSSKDIPSTTSQEPKEKHQAKRDLKDTLQRLNSLLDE